MIETLKSFREKYPFWTGILVGFLACLLIFAFSGLITSGGKTAFQNADQIVKEDYLRMTIQEYAATRNEARANWRYDRLGRDGTGLLHLMKRDPLTDPLSLLIYSRAVSDYSLASPELVQESSAAKAAGSASAVRVIFWIILLLFLGVLAALFFLTDYGKIYSQKIWILYHRLRNRMKKKTNLDVDQEFAPEQANHKTPLESFGEKLTDRISPFRRRTEHESADRIQFEPLPENWEDEPADEEMTTQTLQSDSAKMNESDSLSFDDSLPPFLESEKQSFLTEPADDELSESVSELGEIDAVENDLEFSEDHPEDLVLTPASDVEDAEEESLDEEEDLYPEFADSSAEAEAADEGFLSGEPFDLERDHLQPDEDEDDEIITDESLDDFQFQSSPLTNTAQAAAPLVVTPPDADMQENEPLIHYQTVYKLGDDFFDETFSLDDAEERFVGECGIGIAETINNSDPKAVTAFEVWLFDRDDVQTPTHFLLSEFAFSNEVMLERLKNKGRFDLIEENREYLVEAQTLKMIVTVTDLEYGTGSSNRHSYFERVAFDVKVWQI